MTSSDGGRTPALAAVSTDDERVRVTNWTFPIAGATTGPHRHEVDYVVVPVTGGALAVIEPDGARREMVQMAGSPYLGTAGTEHEVISTSGQPIVFVEVELKR